MPPPSDRDARRAAPKLPPCGPRTALLQADVARLADAHSIDAIELREVEQNGLGRRLPAPLYYIAVRIGEGVAPRSQGRWRYLSTRRDVYAPRRLHRIEVANRILRDIAPAVPVSLVRASRLPPRAQPE